MRFVLMAMFPFLISCQIAAPSGYEKAARHFRSPGDVLWLAYSKPIVWANLSEVQRVPDSKIEFDVARRLVLVGTFLADAQIHVRVERQNVVLWGNAPSGAQAAAAEDMAWRVEGVARVFNHVAVP